jgi:hypothetical protein
VRRWPLLLLAALTACVGDGGCPLVGCVSQLSVQLPPSAVSARACVDEVCSSQVVDGVVQVPLSRRAEGTSVALTVEAVDAAGEVTTAGGDVAVQRRSPGDTDCPDMCVVGAVRLEESGALVEVPPDVEDPAS